MGTVRTMAGRIQALVRRFPFAADAALALALAIAVLISLAVTYGELPPADPTYSQGFTFAVVASMLGMTLHGGHLSSGPRPDRGFAVHATFPLNSDAA